MKPKTTNWAPGITLRQAYDLLYWLYEEVGPQRKLMRRHDGNETVARAHFCARPRPGDLPMIIASGKASKSILVSSGDIACRSSSANRVPELPLVG